MNAYKSIIKQKKWIMTEEENKQRINLSQSCKEILF